MTDSAVDTGRAREEPEPALATPTSEEEVAKLAARVARGELAAETYFAAIERRAAQMVDRESTGGSLLRVLMQAWSAGRDESRTA